MHPERMGKRTWLLALAFAGCGPTVTVTNLNRPSRVLPVREVDAVEVYVTTPPQHVRDLYQLEVRRFGSKDPIRLLRAKAAELGCDGLVVVTDREEQVEAGRIIAVCVESLAPPTAPATPTP